MNKIKKRLLRAMSCKYWVIACRKKNKSSSLLRENRIEGFQVFLHKKFITYADPFLYEHDGINYLFYEKQNLTDMKGTLWCRNLDNPKEKPRLVLEEPFHLSYPQVFQYGENIYMIPETKSIGEVRLYRCEHFPERWVMDKSLLKSPAVDSTVFIKEDVIYIYTYVGCHPEVYAGRLEKKECLEICELKKIYVGPDSRVMRPGGSFFRDDATLYRPVQNCTDYYGQELIFYEAECPECPEKIQKEYIRLSPKQIHVSEINAIGIHTYNQNDKYEVIDILHREIGFRVLLKKIYWKINTKRK